MKSVSSIKFLLKAYIYINFNLYFILDTPYMYDVRALILKISEEFDDHSFEASDALARIGTEDVLVGMIALLKYSNVESRLLAARTLGMMENNQPALLPLLEAMQDKSNEGHVGEFIANLEGFDISDHYVEIFKYYLFGNYKVSMLAKDLLDHKDFDITLRVIKKATKHWNHYSNNVRHDELYDLKKIEVDEIFNDLNDFLTAT